MVQGGRGSMSIGSPSGCRVALAVRDRRGPRCFKGSCVAALTGRHRQLKEGIGKLPKGLPGMVGQRRGSQGLGRRAVRRIEVQHSPMT